MRKLLAAAAIIASVVTPIAASAGSESPDLRPQVNCPGADVYVVYGTTLTCDVNSPQRLHEVYIPSAWTLAAAHTYCAGKGSVGAQTRFNGYSNVCPNIDY